MDLKRDLGDEMEKDSIVVAYLKDRRVAIEFYSALCNTEWKSFNILPEDELIIEKLKGTDSILWSCSWRSAGGIIAYIRDTNYNTGEDYMDFYCSGNEGEISDTVRECFERMGWTPCPYED